MAGKVSPSQFAETVGVTSSAIRKAIAAGRLTADADGLLDPAGALAQWRTNRRRQRQPRLPPAPGGTPAQTAPPAADFWRAKAERETAEASMAVMREAEMRGELVRVDAVELELSRRLVALREALETLADRLAALVAAEPDPRACRLMLRDEHRAALVAFNAAHNQTGGHDAEEP